MKLFCISLERSTERREAFHKNWIEGLGFNIEFFNAVDKNLIPNSDIEVAQKQLDKLSFTPYGTFFRHKYSLSGIMACTRSHLTLLKSIEDEIDDQGVVIFEDDVLPLEGAENLEERISLARKYSPQIESIICNGFKEPRQMYGLQVIEQTRNKINIMWDEKIHATVVPESKSSIVRISPPGSFFNWYSRDGVRRMIKLIEGKDFMSVDIFYGAFAKKGVLGILTPGIGYHPPMSEAGSFITTPPFTYFHLDERKN